MNSLPATLQTLIQKRNIDASIYFCDKRNTPLFQDIIHNIKIKHTADPKKATIIFLRAGCLEVLKDAQPQIVILRIESETEKKQAFPLLEANGFRIYDEISGYAFLFKTSALEHSNPYLPAGDQKVIETLNYGKWKNHPLINKNRARFLDMPAYDLLNANRFDIAIKAHYARLSLNNVAKKWREHAYAEQALRITGPGKEIREHDGSGKTGLNAFLNAFKGLINTDSINSFPPVPIDKNYIAMDGAHRIAAAIARENNIKTVQLELTQNMTSTASYYSGTEHGHPPCDPDVLDEGAIEYCRIRDTAAIALIFPCVTNADKAINELGKIANIVYHKKIAITPKAGQILLRQAYMGHEWINYTGKDSGFDHKVRSCFPHPGTMHALLIDNYKIEDLRPTKDKIRAFYKLGNHAIHITDSTKETLLIAKALFNKNSRFLMARYSGKYLPEFHKKLHTFKNWMHNNTIDPEELCIVSSAILSVFGLRECRDLDILHLPSLDPKFPEDIGSHNEINNLYGHEIEDILGDPRLHFWYMGMKFCTPDLVRTMKTKRAEQKDKIDLVLLEKISCKNSTKIYGILKTYYLSKWYKLYLLLYRVLRKVKRIIKSTLQPSNKDTPNGS
ncbi:MAG: hypothetical protein ACLFP8_08235 [Alphaproteobacteria bacterium]